MNDLQAKLIVAFDAEYRSILEVIRATLARVEAGETAGGASLNEAFRMAHTLKGSAHVVGLASVVTVAHRLESMFARVRDGQMPLGAGEIRLVHTALGLVEDTVGAFHENKPAPDVAAVVAAIEEKLGMKAPARPTPVLAMVPTEPAAPAPAATVTRTVPAAEVESLRLNARHLDQMLGTSGELLNLLRGGRQLDQRLGAISTHVDALAREWDLLRRTAGPAIQALGRSGEYARVGQFLEFVGLQLPPLTKGLRHVRAVTKQTDWDFLNLAEQLHEDVRRARTVPAETVFGGFHKMVRDLATELSRPVDFRMTGLDVAVDRGVLQALKDPLMHMLRNSVGHGVEPEAERLARGKDKVAKLSVKLAIADGRLRVDVEDDGRGLDEDQIRQRARANGMATEAELAQLPRARVFEFIFKAGFSTAAQVTDLAGRGMGMSVVDEALRKLRGQITIDSTSGVSTTFRIAVPVSLANHHLVSVHVGEETFALPGGPIESLRRVTQAEVRVVDGQPTVLVDQKPTPLVSLAAVLQLPDAGWVEDVCPVVILRDEGRALALRVDAVTEAGEALIKNLTPDLQSLNLYDGAVTRGDGAVTLVLSARALIERGTAQRGQTLVAPVTRVAAAPKRTTPARILVVDDSITTRTLERGILEANGFVVGLAVDGVDALQKLSLENYDLVISDVEMPRMDGFTLVAELKKHPRFKDLPVIMVTSLEKPADRERGLTLGANAYVLKQKFDQGGLLDIIGNIL